MSINKPIANNTFEEKKVFWTRITHLQTLKGSANIVLTSVSSAILL